jgi:hypothetical protein
MCSIFWTIYLTNTEKFTNFKDILMKPMKHPPLYIAILLILLTVPFSCKKYIQQQEQYALVNVVTQGTWRVTGYYDHLTNNITDSFAGYSFQFYQNGTVNAILNQQQTNGTWTASISDKSITSNFPSAPYPLSMLNHTWIITDSYTDSVAAEAVVDSSYNILNLHKN